jgi:hypothetical protein
VGVLMAMLWATPAWAKKEEKPKPIDIVAIVYGVIVNSALKE